MAGQADDLSALVALLRTLGDADYAALASKGLVRRARKELRSAQPAGWADGQAVVEVGERTVKIPPAGPAQATCSCPSPGVCQHVIAACLALVEQAAGAEPSEADPSEVEPAPEAAAAETDDAITETAAPEAPPPSPDAWTEIDLAALRRWTGAADWRQAVKLAAGAESSEARVEGTEGSVPLAPLRGDASVVVTLADGTEVRLLPGAVLDALISTAPARLKKRSIAAAVLAARGDAPELEAAAAFQLPADLVRAVQGQLLECVRLGLGRLTASTLARFETVAVSCRSARLYRPARELEACATEIRRIHAREAQADPEGLLERVARLYALTEALLAGQPSPPPALVGRARSAYRETGALTLIGCGAYRWQTPSGFHGLTVLFWDPEGARFTSWSDSRPLGSGDGFDPERRFRGEGPWQGSSGLEQLSRSRFRLEHPRLNDQRRLSASGASRAGALAEPARSELPPAFTSWAELRRALARQPTFGLTSPVPLDFAVRVRPRRCRRPRFDEIEQSLIWPLEDDAGEQLPVVLPFTPWNAKAIRRIEKRGVSTGDSIVGIYRSRPGEALHPVARLSAGESPRIESFAFAGTGDVQRSWWWRLIQRRPRPDWAPPAGEIESEGADLEMTPLRQLLAPARERTLHWAESGLVGQGEDPEWQARCSDLAGAGLIALARALSRAQASPQALLRAVYLLDLHWQAD